MDSKESLHSSTYSDEEKDYVFLKRLEVLYIDNDIETQKVMSKYITDTIRLTACDSLHSAFDIVETKNFDVILCNMVSATELLKEFFNLFSQKIPIIAISNTMDPKIAYMSARMGARDYIVKNERDIKTIAKSIHKVFTEWVKEKEKKNTLEILNDTNVRIVLRDLINTELPITQRLNTDFKNNILINETIKNTYDIQANEILANNRHIIKSLIKMDFMGKEFIEQTVACPNCKSVNVFIHYICDNCKNSNFKNSEMILHKKCGQIISKKKINQTEKILCKICNSFYEYDELNFSIKVAYQCNVCNNAFTNPSIVYSCNSCNYDKFSIDDAKWIELFKFKLKPENVDKIKNNIFLLSNLELFFKGIGYVVKQYEKFVNREQVLGPFELVAYKDKTAYIFIILTKDLQDNLSRIFEIDYAIKMIDKEIKTFAIALFEPQEIVLKLLVKFNITPIIKENIKDVVDEIKNFI
ncbi:MAG: hypothetical protein ACTHL3_07070 [Candidatus Nitrosocosmicus sp.]